MDYGYIRVSSLEQNEGRQVAAIKQVGIRKQRMYVDKQSGKDFDRPAYKQMMNHLRRGDVLYILSIDRLGRNYQEIQEQWRILTKIKQVDIVVIDMPLLDTRREKTLMGTFIADIVLQILCFVAQTERENIRERQRQGIQEAKKQGIRFGRPLITIPEDFDHIVEQWQKKKITTTEAMLSCNMTRSTFYRKAKQHIKEE